MRSRYGLRVPASAFIPQEPETKRLIIQNKTV
jgi:hypothetical protein